MSKTIRIVFPQWQGGNNPLYRLGSELLNWLAPKNDGPTIHIPVPEADTPLQVENGITGRHQIVEQLQATYQAIEDQQPDRIVVFGGDCLVDLAPFSYLAHKYGDDFGILWIDAHPDVMTPQQYANSHAHVLGALMGYGDTDLTRDIKRPVPHNKVMIAGIHSPNDYEAGFLARHHIRTLSPEALRTDPAPVLDWIKEQKIKHLAIHFDLDVLDHHKFRALLMAEPDINPHQYDGIAEGRLTMQEVIDLLAQVDKATDIVGLGIAEHLPWDALNLQNMLRKIPLLND